MACARILVSCPHSCAHNFVSSHCRSDEIVSRRRDCEIVSKRMWVTRRISTRLLKTLTSESRVSLGDFFYVSQRNGPYVEVIFNLTERHIVEARYQRVRNSEFFALEGRKAWEGTSLMTKPHMCNTLGGKLVDSAEQKYDVSTEVRTPTRSSQITGYSVWILFWGHHLIPSQVS